MEARVMMETGWTWEELCNTPEPVIWLVSTVMGLDGEKAQDLSRDRRNMHRRPL